MLGFQQPEGSEGRSPKGGDGHGSVEKIDVSGYLDHIERVLRSGADVGMRNEVLAILRRWQFDTMLTEYCCERAARLLREFTDIGPLQKACP
jgi:hypothetical protein